MRKARKKKHLTKEQLAEECNLSTVHIGHIERGTRALCIEPLTTISKALDVSTDYLLLDVSNAGNKNISEIFNAINGAKKDNYNALYSVIKILAENIDRL